MSSDEPSPRKPDPIRWYRAGAWLLGGISFVLWIIGVVWVILDSTIRSGDGPLVALILTLAMTSTWTAVKLGVSCVDRREMSQIKDRLDKLDGIATVLGRNAALLEQIEHRPQGAAQSTRRRGPRAPRQRGPMVLPPEVADLTRRIDRHITGAS